MLPGIGVTGILLRRMRLQAADDLSCNEFIPWGWGTWIISYEHMLESVAPPAYMPGIRCSLKNMELHDPEDGRNLFSYNGISDK